MTSPLSLEPQPVDLRHEGLFNSNYFVQTPPWDFDNLGATYCQDYYSSNHFDESADGSLTACDTVETDQGKFILKIAPYALVVVLLLSMLKTRKAVAQGCFLGRPGVIYPINFIDERSRRWAFVAVFAMLSYRVLSLFDNSLFWKPDKFEDEDWMETYGWLRVFVGMFNILMLGVVYYPLLACISLRRHLAANFIGVAYLGIWLYNHINIWIICPMSEMTGAAFFQALFEWPNLLCLVLLLLAYVMDLVINLHTLCTRSQSVSIENFIMPLSKGNAQRDHDSLAVKYVKGLLRRKPLPPPSSLAEKLKRKLSYEVVTGYKFSPRMLCTIMVVIMGLYKTVVYFGILVSWVSDTVQELLESVKHEFLERNASAEYDFLYNIVPVARYSFLTANVSSALVHILLMGHILLCHRSNITKLYRGDTSWHFQADRSPANVMIASMKYSGYQIAFMIYGYLLLLLIVFAVCVAVAFLVILPLKNGTSSFLFDILKTGWPTILIGLVVYAVQHFIVRFFFLQERGRYLALNNIRVYHVTTFFLFFFNVLLGLFSCLKRVLFSMAFGTLLISRLDKCLLMRGFERFDSGFNAYLGMCQVDVQHTHPVLVAFTETLARIAEEKAESSRGKAAEFKATLSTRQRVRNKWWKCVTMHNNPTIVLDLLYREVQRRRADGIGTMAVEQVGNVTAGIVAGGCMAGATELSNATDAFDITFF